MSKPTNSQILITRVILECGECHGQFIKEKRGYVSVKEIEGHMKISGWRKKRKKGTLLQRVWVCPICVARNRPLP